MRIGTWNAEGKASQRHVEFVIALQCDVWLMTEVKDELRLPGFHRCLTERYMRSDRRVHWAGVFSTFPMTPQDDPHFASAAALIEGVPFCSTILPWAGGGAEPFGPDEGHAGKTKATLDSLRANLSAPLVWGGDWNHSLSGAEGAGSALGRRHLLDTLEVLDLHVPTADLPHHIEGLLTIDHIAVPRSWTVVATNRHEAQSLGLSDHDCYVIEVQPA